MRGRGESPCEAPLMPHVLLNFMLSFSNPNAPISASSVPPFWPWPSSPLMENPTLPHALQYGRLPWSHKPMLRSQEAPSLCWFAAPLSGGPSSGTHSAVPGSQFSAPPCWLSWGPFATFFCSAHLPASGPCVSAQGHSLREASLSQNPVAVELQV